MRNGKIVLGALVSLLMLNPSDAMGQGRDRYEQSFDYRFQTVAGLADGPNNALWLNSNKQGLGFPETSGAYIRLAADGAVGTRGGFQLGYGADAVVATDGMSGNLIHQLYADLGYRWIRASVGKKEYWGELKNNQLSSGGLTWSGNSAPIPQVRVEIPEFVRLGILGGWFSVKGHIGYGWYTDGQWRTDQAMKYSQTASFTEGLLHHSKAGFLRIGDADRFPLEVTVGLEMYNQFGGTGHNVMRAVGESKQNQLFEYYEFPDGLSAYIEALLPFNGVGDQGDDNGNSLGSWHVAADLLLGDWKVRAYYEHFFEDHSSMLGIEYKNNLYGQKEFVSYGFRQNWMDGLYGLELQTPDGCPVKGVVLELFNSRGMCGPVYRYTNPVILEGVDGRDGMYTNKIYNSYSNYGYSNGSPLLVSPVYNADGDLRFKSNRALIYHLGVNGSIGKHLDWRVLLTTGKHWGTYEDPFNKVERITSGMAEVIYRMDAAYGWNVGVALGADNDSGTLLGDNKGIMITLSKIWNVL